MMNDDSNKRPWHKPEVRRVPESMPGTGTDPFTTEGFTFPNDMAFPTTTTAS